MFGKTSYKYTFKSFRSGNTSGRVCALCFLLIKRRKTVRWKHNSCLSASKCYLKSDAGGVLDLKWHFLPIQRDLSGVERPWRGRKEAGGCMNEWIDKVGFSALEQSVSKRCYFFLCSLWQMFPSLITDRWMETHQCLLHSPRWTS